MGAEHDYGDDDAICFLGDMLKETTSCDRQGSLGSYSRSAVASPNVATTLPSWSVAKRQDSPNLVGAGGIIEEEPSFFLEEDEVPPSLAAQTPNSKKEGFMGPLMNLPHLLEI